MRLCRISRAPALRGNADEFKTLSAEVKLVKVWVPLLGLILGLIALLAGLLLLARSVRSDSPTGAHLVPATT
jgi:hypothetical protein